VFEYTFELYQEGIKAIRDKIVESKNDFDYILGIARGGAVPAVHLSHMLDVPCRILNWQTRDGKSKDYLMAYATAQDVADGMSVLIVDEVIDTGLTIKEIVGEMAKHVGDFGPVYVASLVHKPEADFKPDFVHMDGVTDWVEFWWEK
jgi:hypoxanthine phosphoribosyltransferase